MQVGGCSIYGWAHESGCCMAQDDAAKEVNYMANQNRQGFHIGGFSGYQQGGNFNQNQGQGWRSHPGNQFNTITTEMSPIRNMNHKRKYQLNRSQ